MILVVIDLGSNTFHILVAKITKDQTFKVIHKERLFTKLVEAGIERISPISYQRSLEAIKYFKELANKYRADVVRIIGTSALREASNGDQFIREVHDKYGLEIELINGEREGELIQKGVALALDSSIIPFTYLIMDIGGGSVEFIIVDKDRIVYNKSYLIGMSILHNISDISDGANKSDIQRLNTFIEHSLDDLLKKVKQYPNITLVGSAGAFEILVSLMDLAYEQFNFVELPVEDFEQLYVKIIFANRNERQIKYEIPLERLDYIGVAFQLIKFIVDNIHPGKIIVSKYALKEGVIGEFLD